MDTVIWIVVAVVVVLLILGLLVALMGKRRTEQRKGQAAELRQDARSRTPDLDEADVRAREAEVEAERARLEAQRAETRATEAEQARAAEQAGYEDRIREADRVDPAVDTGSSDYQPDTRYPADTDEAPPRPEERVTARTHPEGAAHNPDGTVTYPDGTVHREDGSRV
jgi:FtsZ-interacting cell division protein ZipA